MGKFALADSDSFEEDEMQPAPTEFVLVERFQERVHRVSSAAAVLVQATARLALDSDDNDSPTITRQPEEEGAAEAIADDLKLEMHANLNAVSEQVDRLKQEMVQTVDSLKQELVQKVDSLKEEMVAANKNHNLTWAIQNSDLMSFFYYMDHTDDDHDDDWQRYDSKDLVKKVLLAFRRGESCILPNAFTYCNETSTDLSDKDFRGAFSEQIHSLTGVKPRIEFNTTEKYEIFYSY